MLRKFALSLMIMLMFCGVSCANFIYATSDGSLGTIAIGSSSDIEPSIQYTGDFSSPFLASYWNGSGTNILLIDRYASESGDKGYIFSPSNLANITESKDINGVFGTEIAGYAENGYSLFLTSGSTIYEIRTSNFKTVNSFDCSQVVSADGVPPEIIGLAVDTQTIHILADTGEGIKYLRFEGQLNKNKDLFVSRDVPSGSSAIMSVSNYPIVGHDYGVDTMDSRSRFYRTVSTDYPVKAMCIDEEGYLFLGMQYHDGENYVNIVEHSLSTSNFPDTIIESSSPNFKLLRDNDHKETFAAMTDERIIIFTYKNGSAAVSEYTASELGGNPIGIASASVSGFKASSSSSGCDYSAGLGLMMCAVAGFILRRK